MDPLTPLAIAAAGQTIKPLARGFGQLADFASVLAAEVGGGDAASNEVSSPPNETFNEIARQATEIVDRLLRGHPIDANRSLRIDVLPGGELQLAEDHPRAAEIEAILNNDGELRELTSRLDTEQNPGIQLHWPTSNLTPVGLSPYTMELQRPSGG